MKPWLITTFVLGCIAAVILCVSFNYSVQLGLYHILSLTVLLALASTLILLIKYSFRNHTVSYFISNGIAGGLWVFLCFFYTAVLGSNHFWGNTITFEILKNYLTSFDSILSILPVEKWLLVSILVLYFLIILAAFYFIRLRKTYFPGNNTKPGYFSLKKAGVAALLLLGTVLLCRKPIMNLKRTMHFKQEPLLYFVFGPMWDIHSDQLLTTTHVNSEQDLKCISSIRPAPEKDKIAIIILLDALRSDHLPMYGYSRNTTPFLDSLYKSENLFKINNSFSNSTNTIGGISGLFYSKDWNDFNFSQLNMMQYFQLSGYTTSAFLTGYHSGWYGLSAMYRNYCDNFYESTSAYHTATDDDLVTLKKIESAPFKPGSFIFIHLLSTHPVGKRDKAFRLYYPDKMGLTTNMKEALVNNYDNGILQGDYVISKIFQKLKKENILDKTTLFIVGDHGDLLGEEGEYGHAGGLHEKLLEVPILIYDRDPQWYKETRIASLMDIAPTLTDRIFNQSPTCWQGRSLHNQLQLPSSTKVSASTVKTDHLNGMISFTNDTLDLKIFDKNGELQRTALKVDSVTWKTIFQKQ